MISLLDPTNYGSRQSRKQTHYWRPQQAKGTEEFQGASFGPLREVFYQVLREGWGTESIS